MHASLLILRKIAVSLLIYSGAVAIVTVLLWSVQTFLKH